MTLVLVTGNRGKLEEARRLLGPELEAVDLDLPELQSLDLFEILDAKAEEAYRRCGRPVLVEETSFELAAWNGFPGPLVKWMLQAVGAEGIARTALALGQPGARARCVYQWFDGGRRINAEGVVDGQVVLPRGGAGFGWDPIFRPDGQELTFAELPPEIKDRVSHRGRALRALVAKLATAGVGS